MLHSISETSWSIKLKIFMHAHWHVLRPQYKFRRNWRINLEIIHFLAFFVVVLLLELHSIQKVGFIS